MDKKNTDSLSYLQTTSEYFSLINNQNNYPKVLQEVQIKFDEILRKITNRTKTESFKETDCYEITKQIDQTIFAVGEITVKAQMNEPKELNELKERIWHLLETLEQYCVKNYKISIW